MTKIIDLPKKARVTSYLSKYKATQEQIEDVFNIYTYVVSKMNELNIDIEKYNQQEIINLLERTVEDIYSAIKNNKSFLINDYTLEYLIDGKNKSTLLQFESAFRFLVGTDEENRNTCYYALSSFIEYLIKSSSDSIKYKELDNYPILKKIVDSYNKSIGFLNELNEPALITTYNYLVALSYYQELINENDYFIEDIGVYLYNNYESILERIDNMKLMGEDETCDEYENILEEIKSRKIKKM